MTAGLFLGGSRTPARPHFSTTLPKAVQRARGLISGLSEKGRGFASFSCTIKRASIESYYNCIFILSRLLFALFVFSIVVRDLGLAI